MSTPTPPRYLLDTNVLVAYSREGPLSEWMEATYHLRDLPTVPIISIVTEGELRSLSLQLGWGDRKKRRLEELIGRFVPVPLEFPGLIRAYAEIDCFSVKSGRSMGKNDVWIAATAHVAGTPLLTTDKDFDHLDPLFLTRHYIDPATHI